MTVMVTGAAGFIGFHLSRALIERGESVVGVDDLNAYYDPALKRARIDRLANAGGAFRFVRLDIADGAAMAAFARRYGPFRIVLHLAAQAGVRHALRDPFSYGRSNLMGQISVFEACRGMGGLEHVVYASSSSVYGGAGTPWAEDDRVDSPVSLYAATKRAGELMARTYSHLHRIPATGLRFFTVYGPWGRPDMAAWLFVDAILAGRPIPLFNDGDMKRDFTYIDDVVAGALRVAGRPPDPEGEAPHRIYNIGGARSEPLRRFVAVVECATGRRARIEALPMQPGDVAETRADASALERDFGVRPATPIEEGIPRFVSWFRAYHGV